MHILVAHSTGLGELLLCPENMFIFSGHVNMMHLCPYMESDASDVHTSSDTAFLLLPWYNHLLILRVHFFNEYKY